MTRALRFTQNYLLFALPLVLAMMAWSTFAPENTDSEVPIVFRLLRELLSWNLMLWFLTLFLFLVTLVILPNVREATLLRLANVKERDEREQYITGKAARKSYISTLSILILFLFLSIFTIEIYRVPAAQAINGKRGTVTIGMHFTAFDTTTIKPTDTHDVLFESEGISISKAAIVLLLLIWQLGSFNFYARKEQG